MGELLKLYKIDFFKKAHPLLFSIFVFCLIFTNFGWVYLTEVMSLGIALLFLPWLITEVHQSRAINRVRFLAFSALTLLGIWIQGKCWSYSNPIYSLSSFLLILYLTPITRTNQGFRFWALCLWGIFIILFLLPIYYFIYEHTALSDTALMSIFQTNIQESIEYITTSKLFPSTLLTLFLVLTIFLFFRKRSGIIIKKRIIYIILPLFWTQCSSSFMNEFITSYKTYRDEISLRDDIASRRRKIIQPVVHLKHQPSHSRRILVIIGESTARRHMDLYGYSKKTTPLLSTQLSSKEMSVFTDVISPHVLTMQSLKKVLTNSNNDNRIPFTESISLIDVFHQAGFKSIWISNQQAAGIWDNDVAIIARSADRFYFCPKTVGARIDESPDEVVFNKFDDLCNSYKENTIVFTHLMGAHFDYNQRIPQSFKDNNKYLGFSEYDLAILYQDKIIYNLIERARMNNFDTVIYFSDHGECPHEDRRHNPDRFTPEMCEIPFIIWLNPLYSIHHPDLIKRIDAAKNKSFMTDDFFHTLLDLADLDSPLFEPARSIINPAYICKTRKTVHNTIVYSPALKIGLGCNK